MRFATLAASLAISCLVVSATRNMRRPSNYKSMRAHSGFHMSRDRPSPGCSWGQGGKVNMGYYTNWAIYDEGFTPLDIDTSTLTHIIYAFADVDPVTGTAFLTDTWADQQIPYPGDDTGADGNNLYGNLKQLYLIKRQNRNIKTLLSFGGWTYSQDGHFAFVTNGASRTTFVKTAIQLLEDNGFDGIDIDWEYAKTENATSSFVKLLAEMRASLDAHAKAKRDDTPYQISVAVPAGSEDYQSLKVKEMDRYLTYWSLMAYDYAGDWSELSDYLSNVYGGAYSGVSTNASATWYLRNGADPKKFVIGMPIYGVGFENTAGIFQPFNGTGPGTWEGGVYDYKALPFDGAKVVNDFKNVSSYSYDSTKKELISYDTPVIAAQKAAWIISHGLGGAMFWELSGDKNGTESLVWTTAKVMQKLDNTPNHLNYPGSQFDNVRAGMKAVNKHHRKRMVDHF